MEGTFRVWNEYLNNQQAWGDGIRLIARNDIRPGCEPFTLIHHPSHADHAVVLLHGLTDSPWYMQAIARRLHEQGGVNVFVPLLQGHGLKDPAGMKGVSHRVWLNNAVWALRAAKQTARRVSVGGLSTGGALATLLAFRDQEGEDLIDGRPRNRQSHSSAGEGNRERLINGGVLLFSAALRLKSVHLLKGHTKEAILRTPVAAIADLAKEGYLRLKNGRDPLTGDDCYRYSTMDLGACRLNTSDAADEQRSVALRGCRIIYKKK